MVKGYTQGRGEHAQLPELGEVDASFRAAALMARVDLATTAVYRLKVLEVERLGEGPAGYASLVRFLRARSGQVTAAYLKTFKSAVVFVLSAAGRPMAFAESQDLDYILQGMSATEPPRALRGAIDEAMVAQIALVAYKDGDAESAHGVIVAFGISCRPRDIKELEASRVQIRQGTVQVRAKRTRYLRQKLGEWETHPVMTEGALALLATRCALHPTGPLFPGWNEAHARALVQRVAVLHQWDPELVWDGAHSLRHGGAVAAMENALTRVRAVGAWASTSSARHYSRPNAARKRNRGD